MVALLSASVVRAISAFNAIRRALAGGDGQKIVRGLLHGDRQYGARGSDRRAIRRVERRADAAEQPLAS